MLRLLVHLHAFTVVMSHEAARPWSQRSLPLESGADRPWRGDAGQTTAEYALVLLGAAAIAALLITWASKSGAIGKLFDAVLSSVLGSVK